MAKQTKPSRDAFAVMVSARWESPVIHYADRGMYVVVPGDRLPIASLVALLARQHSLTADVEAEPSGGFVVRVFGFPRVAR